MVNNNNKIDDDDDDEEKVVVPMYGDILESILSNVPLVELASASLVSTEWKVAVSSSLRHLNPAKPWLFIHTQATRSPYTTTSRAYDTRSQSWMEIHRPSIKHVSTLRSAHSGMLYMLSPTTLSFSSDPFHLTWHHAESPFVWRTDPIVALVGNKLVVAGGGCDFEDDPLAVEIYDVNNGRWESCEFMPSVLKDSAASNWLSVATDGRLMYVVERESPGGGVMHTFDPESNKWRGPFRILPPTEERVSCSIITYNYSSGRLILIGLLIGGGLKMWWVDPENPEAAAEEIGEMPKEMFERSSIGGKNSRSSISACSASNWVYIYDNTNWQVGEIYVCEVVVKKSGGGGGGCRWRREAIPVNQTIPPGERVVFTCSEVSIPDVKEALRSPSNWKCNPIPMLAAGLA